MCITLVFFSRALACILVYKVLFGADSLLNGRVGISRGSHLRGAILLSYRNQFQRVTAPGPRCGDPRAVSLPLVPTAHCTVSHVN